MVYRALIHPEDDERASLGPDEVHHLISVLRSKPGDPFLGFTLEGNWYCCRLGRAEGRWFAQLIEPFRDNRESFLHITLAQALIKKARFEWVLQKASELGVAEIIPLLTKRTEIGPRKAAERLSDRWQRILIESVKQCGRSRIPVLREATGIGPALATFPCQLRIALDEEGGGNLKEVLGDLPEKPQSCIAFVGPEGGWDGQERELFQKHGVVRVRLGPRILRAETAPLAIVSILQYELGDLSLGPGI